MTKANELLEDEDPPRYKLIKIEVEMSVSTEQTIGGGVKIPILPFGASIEGEYAELVTVTDNYTFVPRESVPVGEGPEFGLEEFILDLHKELRVDLAESIIVATRASRKREFVIGRKADASLSFFDAVEIGAGVNLVNTHKVTFTFCLAEENGECVPSS